MEGLNGQLCARPAAWRRRLPETDESQFLVNFGTIGVSVNPNFWSILVPSARVAILRNATSSQSNREFPDFPKSFIYFPVNRTLNAHPT
jgi:hypothetical protein